MRPSQDEKENTISGAGIGSRVRTSLGSALGALGAVLGSAVAA